MDLNDVISKLGGDSLVIERYGKEIYRSNEAGLAPLVKAYRQGLLNGTVVINKTVGGAAARLLMMGGARAVYTPLASESAVELLVGKIGAQKIVDALENDETDQLSNQFPSDQDFVRELSVKFNFHQNQ